MTEARWGEAKRSRQTPGSALRGGDWQEEAEPQWQPQQGGRRGCQEESVGWTMVEPLEGDGKGEAGSAQKWLSDAAQDGAMCVLCY